MSGFDFVAEKEQSKLVADMIRALKEQRSINVEYPVKDKDGREYQSEVNITLLRDASGSPKGIVSVIRDITERKRMEHALRDSEEMSRGMLESAATGIYLVQDGKFKYVNPLFSGISGYAPAELLGSDSMDYIHPDDREIARIKVIENLKGINDLPHEFRFMRKDGQSTWILEKVASIEYKGRRAAIGSFMDISERKRIEEVLRQRSQDIEQRTNQLLAALEEKELLLREVHHRVKNNLAAIIALMQMQRKTLGEPAMTAAFSDLENQIRSMSLIHERLYQSHDLSQIDFQDYLSALVSHLRTSLNTPRDFRCSVKAKGIALELDTAVPVGMIVNELVTNALKYAFPDNRPRRGADQCEITISLERKDAAYTLIVDDNGVGLPEGLDLATTSTLGLRLVKMLGAHQLGGKLTLNRARGTRFVLKFNAEQKG